MSYLVGCAPGTRRADIAPLLRQTGLTIPWGHTPFFFTGDRRNHVQNGAMNGETRSGDQMEAFWDSMPPPLSLPALSSAAPHSVRMMVRHTDIQLVVHVWCNCALLLLCRCVLCSAYHNISTVSHIVRTLCENGIGTHQNFRPVFLNLCFGSSNFR